MTYGPSSEHPQMPVDRRRKRVFRGGWVTNRVTRRRSRSVAFVIDVFARRIAG